MKPPDLGVRPTVQLRGLGRIAFCTIVLCLCFNGCSFSRPTLNKQSFAFSGPKATGRPAANAGAWLEIRRVTVAAPYDSQSFVYRTGEFSYERDPYAEFLVAPEEALETSLRRYLAQSGEFRGVIEPGSAVSAGVVAEVTADQLYGDFRNRSAPAAVMELTISLINGANPGGKVLFRKTYARRIGLKARTAAALVAGWNEGLEQIMEAMERDWRQKK